MANCCGLLMKQQPKNYQNKNMKKTSLVIGVDIGGTNTKFGIVTKRGRILAEGAIKTSEYQTVESFIEALHDSLLPIITKYQAKHEIKGIGNGAPNGNFFTGAIENAPNLHWKGIVPLTKLIEEKFKIPAVINNDANAAAIGEMTFGAGKGLQDFIMITLGTGVGSGIVVNGKVLYGNHALAGELGHTIIRYNGRKHWSTGLRGTLEAYCSATGIAMTAKKLIKKQETPESLLDAYAKKDLDSKAVYDCAMKGDALAKKVYAFTGKVLGEALANFTMFSSPEAIILFGGVTKAGDLLLKPVKESMESHLLEVFKGRTKLIFSELKEADAAILGASALVWEIRESD